MESKEEIKIIRQGAVLSGCKEYEALKKVLAENNPENVIEIISDSGLRGRGGAGFPTGKKWKIASETGKNVQKYVCCNAYSDSVILEKNPHTVLEAMAIAGYAAGADRGYIYLRAKAGRIVEKVREAIQQAEEQGKIGKNICNTGFDFMIEVRLAAERFVCGEETAMLSVLEGDRGEPGMRLPYPAVSGLYGQPTIVNNAETFANIPLILLKGAEWFASIGTGKSKGTKIFSVTGAVNHTGIVEVPFGTTLRTIIEDICGGMKEGRSFKAAWIGGGGGCIPADYLDLPLDYDNLTSLGAAMGTGSLAILDGSVRIPEEVKTALKYMEKESCGRCVPCRMGIRRMAEMLNRMLREGGTAGELEELKELAYYLKDSAACGLGQTAPNPFLSTLRYFREEYLREI